MNYMTTLFGKMTGLKIHETTTTTTTVSNNNSNKDLNTITLTPEKRKKMVEKAKTAVAKMEEKNQEEWRGIFTTIELLEENILKVKMKMKTSKHFDKLSKRVKQLQENKIENKENKIEKLRRKGKNYRSREIR